MKICLIGFQGAGKTTVGRWLASHLSLDFFDLDDEILAHYSLASIKAVFEMLGEPQFRKEERRWLAPILARPSYVIALGGGAVEALKTVPDDVQVVYLFRTLRVLEAESKLCPPFWIDGENPLSSLHQRWEERHPVYFHTATAVVLVEKRSVEDDAYKVLRSLKVF